MTSEAPTDPQLAYIARLCADRDLETPEAVYSKAEASEIISRIRAGTYRAEDYAVTEPVPF